MQHDLGTTGPLGVRAAWQVPADSHNAKGWKITGSLLGLDVPLARMWLKRMDSTTMPRRRVDIPTKSSTNGVAGSA